MNEFLTVLALAALPAFGNFAGGLLTSVVQVSGRTLSLALHLAAGIVLAVVSLELMPEALDTDLPWVPLIAFVLGGAGFMGLERLTSAVSGSVGRLLGGSKIEDGKAGPWVILLGVTVDLFTDGIMIGTGSTLSLGLGLLLALGQVPADIPEGFATIANFKRAGYPRRTQLLLSAALAVPVFLGAAIGFLALRDAPTLAKLSVLAFAAGLLTALAVESIVPEAHEEGKTGYESLVLVGGFVLFAGLGLLLE